MSATTAGGEFRAPTEFLENFNVSSSNPLGIRLTKDKNRVTNVELNSPLTGKVFLGDRVVAADGQRINSGEELVKMIRKAQDRTIAVTIQHGTWSFSTHRCTTVERILMDKDNDKLTGRAINIYHISLRMSPTPETETCPVDLHVRYDARERLVVAQVDPNSVTAVHLHPGDCIREVNGKTVASKIMLRSCMLQGAKKGEIQLLVESDAGASEFRDTVEMAPDVLRIAAKQLEVLKKKQTAKPKGCLSKGPPKGRIAFAHQHIVCEIASDYDTAKLRPCKGAKQ